MHLVPLALLRQDRLDALDILETIEVLVDRISLIELIEDTEPRLEVGVFKVFFNEPQRQ